VCLVLSDSQRVALVQVDLLVVLCLPQEKLRLLSEFNLNNNSCLVLLGRLASPLDQILADFVAIVLENPHPIHPVPNHPKQKDIKNQSDQSISAKDLHIDELLVRSFVQCA